jgi:hypothetical protein
MTRKRKIARRIGHRFSPGQPQHRVLAGSSPSPGAILFHVPPGIGASSFARVPEGHHARSFRLAGVNPASS